MKILLSSLILFFSLNSYGSDDFDSVVSEESNFQKLSLGLKENLLGLVLMFHAEHCPYCAIMDNEILSPMIRSGDYDKLVLIRKLQIDESRDVKDFVGKVVDPSDISDRYNATLTPTLVFLDHQGNQKAEMMIGINTVELFGAYLDAEIDKLVENVNPTNKIATNN